MPNNNIPCRYCGVKGELYFIHGKFCVCDSCKRSYYCDEADDYWRQSSTAQGALKANSTVIEDARYMLSLLEAGIDSPKSVRKLIKTVDKLEKSVAFLTKSVRSMCAAKLREGRKHPDMSGEKSKIG